MEDLPIQVTDVLVKISQMELIIAQQTLNAYIYGDGEPYGDMYMDALKARIAALQ